jgi:TolA-binding protein
MKETINYYQKLYESAMAFAMRKVLRGQKKRKRLELREITLENQIQNLNKQIEELEIVIQDKIKKKEFENYFLGMKRIIN